MNTVDYQWHLTLTCTDTTFNRAWPRLAATSPRMAAVSPPAMKALQLALREAIWLKAGAIGSEHILLGLLRCDDSDINAVLAELGVMSDDLRKATLRTIGRAA